MMELYVAAAARGRRYPGEGVLPAGGTAAARRHRLDHGLRFAACRRDPDLIAGERLELKQTWRAAEVGALPREYPASPNLASTRRLISIDLAARLLEMSCWRATR